MPWSPRLPRVPLVASLVTALALSGVATVAPAIVPGLDGSLAPAAAAVPTTGQVPWVPDGGPVRAVANDGNSGQYIAGSFTSMSLAAQGLAVVNPATASDYRAVDRAFPGVDGTVSAIVSDGAGGWFVGGDFQRIGSPSVLRPNLAHVTSDGSVDEYWQPTVSGQVFALSLVDGVLYVAGAFTQPGAAVVALDAAGGSEIASFGTTAGNVNALAVKPGTAGLDGAVVYAQTSSGLEAFGCTVNEFGAGVCTAVDGWTRPQLDGSIQALALDSSNNWLYFGGSFTTVTDVSVPYLARVPTSDGLLDTTWTPSPNASVRALDFDANGVLYAGGDFTSVNHTSVNQATVALARYRLAAFDTVEGTVTNWDPGADDTVASLKVSGTSVFVGGDFTAVGTGMEQRYRFAQLALSDGVAEPLALLVGGPVSALALDTNGRVAVGGSFTSVALEGRRGTAQIDASGDLTDWRPMVTTGSVRAIAAVPGGVVLGGDFTLTGEAGSIVEDLALVDGSAGMAQSFPLQIDGAVNALYTSPLYSTSVFVGGEFRTLMSGVSAFPRGRLAKLTLNAGTWQVDSWQADLTGGGVNALTGDYSRQLYVGGGFTGCNSGTCSANAAAFHMGTSALSESWRPAPNGDVNALAWNSYSRQVYLGGAFTSLAGNSNRAYAGAVADVGSWSDTALTNLRAWNPRPNGAVYALAFPGAPSGGGSVLMGGAFTTIASTYPRAGLASVTAEGLGTARSWNPLVAGQSSVVRAISWPAGTNVALGGTFGIDGQSVENFAQLEYVNYDAGPFEFTNTDFGVVASGSKNLTVLAYNRSGRTINTSVTAGVNMIAQAAGVAYVSDTCSTQFGIPNGALCTIDLRWTPGPATLPPIALVELTIGGSGGAPSAAELTGTTYPPGPLTFANAPGFGDVPVGTSSTATVTVTNTGLSAATPTAITAAGSGVSVTGGTCAAARPLAVNGTCTVTLAWTPSTRGALTGASLTIDYPDGVNASDSVALTGTGRQPGELTFTSGAFGPSVVGTSSALTVTVTNTGNDIATPSAITVTGAGVSKTGGTCAVSTTIAADGTCTVRLAWTPATTGALADAALTITYPNGATAANSVVLSGTGVQPGPLAFTSGAFGIVTAGTSTALSVTVTNTGTSAADPSAITVVGSGVTKTGGTCSTSTSIAANGTCTVLLTWNPPSAGALTGASLAIAYPDGASAVDELALTGAAASSRGGGGGGGGSGGSGAPATPSATPTPAPTVPAPISTPEAPPASSTGGSGVVTRIVAGPISRAFGPAVAATSPLPAVRPSRRLAAAPSDSAQAGTVVRIGLRGLRPSTRFTVAIGYRGSWHAIGTMLSSAAGLGVAPAFTSRASRDFTLRVSPPDGAHRYLKVRIR